MNKRPSFHIPIIVWLFLAGLFFSNFTPDKGNNTKKEVAATDVKDESSSAADSFESYVDNVYKDADLASNGLSKSVFERALTGYFDIKSSENSRLKKDILSVVDFTMASTEKRLWIIDIKNAKLLYHTLVAHGKNTGDQYAKAFSNQPSSNMSSLGFYTTGEIYLGKHGRSLALDGLEKGFNDNARQRAVVMHSAEYVSENYIQKIGRLGRSWGCPALPVVLAPEIINTVANGSCLFIYYPDKTYEQNTAYNNKENAVNAFESTVASKVTEVYGTR